MISYVIPYYAMLYYAIAILCYDMLYLLCYALLCYNMMCLLLGKNWKTASLREGSNQPLDRSWAWTFWDCDFDIPVDNAGESIVWLICLFACMYVCLYFCLFICFVCMLVCLMVGWLVWNHG